MTQTLFSARLDLARIIANVVEGAATSGSTTTLVDTNFPYRMDRANAPIDDFYNRGTLFLKTSTQACDALLNLSLNFMPRSIMSTHTAP